MPTEKFAAAFAAVMFLACGTVVRNLPELPSGLTCLKRPFAEYERVSYGFHAPDHPFRPRQHAGVDIPAPVGTAVLAVAAGEVASVNPVRSADDPKGDYEASVEVRFSGDWTYSVAHLSRVDVKVGDEIAAGQVLGLSGGAVGAPGSGHYTTGPHLHFSLTYLGAHVNPEPYFCEPLHPWEEASEKTENP